MGTGLAGKDERTMERRSTLTEAEIIFIRAQRVARLATADKHGTPHQIPVCYAFDGKNFYTPLDEKPKRVDVMKLQRVRNIEARHEASLLIDQYNDDWTQLGYVLIHGQADLLMPENEAHAYTIKLLRMRYVQYRTMVLERCPVITIVPDHVTSWGPALSS